GFTLVELLIAITIFAIMSTITTSALYNAFTTRDRLALESKRNSALQLAFVLIERDITQIIDRKIMNEKGVFPAVFGQESQLEFSRGGIINPRFTKKQSTLQRITYQLSKGRLIRFSEIALDTDRENPKTKTLLLQHVTSLSFSYIDKHKQIH